MNTYEINGIRGLRYLRPSDLNHVGLFFADESKTVEFYRDMLGFTITDVIPDKRVFFMRLNSEHHILSLFPETFRIRTDRKGMQHAAWEVETYEELRKSGELFRKNGFELELTTRRVPGSNYAVYLLDREGNRIELAFGIEKIGWQGRPKPLELWQKIGMKGDLPDTIETGDYEVDEARSEFNGFADDRCTYTIDKLVERRFIERKFMTSGEKSARPFKLSRISYYALSCDNLDELAQFYTTTIGLETVHQLEDTFLISGRCSNRPRFFLELAGNEQERDRKAGGTIVCFEMRTYRELVNCCFYLDENGVRIANTGRYEIPGIFEERYFDVRDPDGNTIRLSYSPSANGLHETSESKLSSDQLPESIDCN